MTRPRLLEVRLHDRLVGTLSLLTGDQSLFAFDEAYAGDPDRPTLSLSYKDVWGGLITDVRPTRTRLPPFFSNLLPEGPLRTYLAARAGVKEMREFALLALLGGDLPGAVSVSPADDDPWPLDPEPAKDETRRGERAMRFSLAGVQMKFSAVMAPMGGLTIPATGAGGDWVVKLPSAAYAGVPENEFSMMELARAAGVDTPEVRLVPVTDIAGLPRGVDSVGGLALAVKRFDRPAPGTRVHIEDFAQVFGVYPERKYERASYRNLAEVIWAETGAGGVAEFVRRLVFNALIGNADMHLKNWSFIYPDGRQAALAPAYDFVSTIAYLEDDRMALSLNGSGTKDFRSLSVESFRRFAEKAGLPRKVVTDAVEEMRDRFAQVWAKEAAHLPITQPVKDAIARHRRRLAL